MNIHTVVEILYTIAFLGYIVWVAATLSNLKRRITQIERRKKGAPAIGVDAMDAVDNVTAMITGLRRQLINQGFSPEAAEALVVHVMQGAANHGGKK